MIQPIPDALSPYLTPEALWRAGCSWEAQGYSEHGEWLQDAAVDLLDIRALPEVAHPYELRAELRDLDF